MLTAFRDVLRRTARTLGLEPALHLAGVRAAWPDVVGPALAAAASPRALRGYRLLVDAEHPLAAQEIRLREEEILERLRERFPDAGLRQIRVAVRGRGAGDERGGG